MAYESVVDWADIVTWLLVLAGWSAVHLIELSHERRKEKREAVTRTINEIKEIENDAISFHSSEIYCAQASDSLTWRVVRLNRCLQRPPLTSLDIPLPLMVRFKKALTLKNTDASSFVSQAYHGELIVDIRKISDEIIEGIEAARDRKFQ